MAPPSAPPTAPAVGKVVRPGYDVHGNYIGNDKECESQSSEDEDDAPTKSDEDFLTDNPSDSDYNIPTDEETDHGTDPEDGPKKRKGRKKVVL